MGRHRHFVLLVLAGVGCLSLCAGCGRTPPPLEASSTGAVTLYVKDMAERLQLH